MTDNTRVFNVFPVFFRGKKGGFQGDEGEGHTLWTERSEEPSINTKPPLLSERGLCYLNSDEF